MGKSTFLPLGDGLLRSTILTVALMVVYAVIMTFSELSPEVNSLFFLATTILSIMYGTIYSVRKINKKGWLIGIILAALYMLIIYVLSIIAGNSPIIEVTRLIRFLLALGVGALSGMLGINLS